MPSRRLNLRRIVTPILVACLCTFGLMLPPSAAADQLSNGLTATCTPDSDVHVTCIIGGCARVHGDYVIDAVHVMWNGIQSEYDFKCINGATARWGHDNGGKAFKIGVQGCRKKDLEGDWCGPWADYNYTPPAKPQEQAPVKCPAGSKTSTVPAGQQCEAAPVADIKCPDGSPTPTVPAGQQCAAIPEVTNAIQASFGAPGATSIAFNVTNTSNLAAACNYVATTNSINPLAPRKTTRQFNVPANGNHTENFSGAPTLSTYNVVLSCHDANGKQKSEMGHVETSVTW